MPQLICVGLKSLQKRCKMFYGYNFWLLNSKYQPSDLVGLFREISKAARACPGIVAEFLKPNFETKLVPKSKFVSSRAGRRGYVVIWHLIEVGKKMSQKRNVKKREMSENFYKYRKMSRISKNFEKYMYLSLDSSLLSFFDIYQTFCWKFFGISIFWHFSFLTFFLPTPHWHLTLFTVNWQ